MKRELTVDLVRPIFDPLGQKSRLGASGLFASSAQKGSEREFNNSSINLVVIRLDKSFQFLKEVLSWVPNVVGKRSDKSGNDKSILRVGNNVSDDKSSWSSSRHDQSVQEDFPGTKTYVSN